MQQKMIDEIKSQEGEFLFVYDDANDRLVKTGSTLVGNPTIGYGRCLSTRGVTVSEAEYLLANDIAFVEHQLGALPWWQGLSLVRQDVISNMCFNIGFAGLMSFTNMIAAIQRGDFKAAADEALDSHWAAQVGGRAKMLAQQLETGNYG
jgi:lysozyme